MIIVPHMNDILMGRGGTNNKHIGNQKFRKLAESKLIQYSTCSRKKKPTIYRGLVMEVFSMNPPGRFLKKDKKTEQWIRVGLDNALEKASRTLRDAVAAYNSGTLQWRVVDSHHDEPSEVDDVVAQQYCKKRPPSDEHLLVGGSSSRGRVVLLPAAAKRQKLLAARSVNEDEGAQQRRRNVCGAQSSKLVVVAAPPPHIGSIHHQASNVLLLPAIKASPWAIPHQAWQTSRGSSRGRRGLVEPMYDLFEKEQEQGNMQKEAAYDHANASSYGRTESFVFENHAQQLSNNRRNLVLHRNQEAALPSLISSSNTAVGAPQGGFPLPRLSWSQRGGGCSLDSGHISRRGGVLVVDDDDDRAAATFSNVVVGDHDRKRIVSSRNTPVELQTSTPSQSHHTVDPTLISPPYCRSISPLSFINNEHEDSTSSTSTSIDTSPGSPITNQAPGEQQSPHEKRWQGGVVPLRISSRFVRPATSHIESSSMICSHQERHQKDSSITTNVSEPDNSCEQLLLVKTSKNRKSALAVSSPSSLSCSSANTRMEETFSFQEASTETRVQNSTNDLTTLPDPMEQHEEESFFSLLSNATNNNQASTVEEQQECHHGLDPLTYSSLMDIFQDDDEDTSTETEESSLTKSTTVVLNTRIDPPCINTLRMSRRCSFGADDYSIEAAKVSDMNAADTKGFGGFDEFPILSFFG